MYNFPTREELGAAVDQAHKRHLKITGHRAPELALKMNKLEMAFERAFVQAGGTLLAGCDPTGNGAVLAGYGDQREVELLVEAGFTPLEALRIGRSVDVGIR